MRGVWHLAVMVVVGSVGSDGFGAEVERREEGNLVIENVPAIPEEIVERMRQYQSTRAASLRN